jgi:hypothetical protein
MQVGMLATFRVAEDRPTFGADLVARWRECREFAPPFNLLYRSLPVPSWVELESGDIDLDYHLRHSALPAPGSQRELGVLVSRLHSAKMDRRYPHHRGVVRRRVQHRLHRLPRLRPPPAADRGLLRRGARRPGSRAPALTPG